MTTPNKSHKTIVKSSYIRSKYFKTEKADHPNEKWQKVLHEVNIKF